MVVCITGMHRSGTSMVAKVLRQGGLYLGPDSDLMPPLPDNPDGHWENIKFNRINDEILEQLGEGWDYAAAGAAAWPPEDRLLRLKGKAEMLFQDFVGHEPWGWKDPRNCLTSRFWIGFFPHLKVVHCVRNPLEVALSLRQRNFFSFTHSLLLWKIYNQRLLESIPPEHCLLTHYESYFADPAKEVRRLLGFLNMSISEEALKPCCAAVVAQSRHHRFTMGQLLEAEVAPDIIELYRHMCVRAGWTPSGAARPAAAAAIPPLPQLESPNPPSDGGAAQLPGRQGKAPPGESGQRMRQLDTSAVELELLRREALALRPRVTEQRATIDRLQTQLDEQTRQVRQANEKIRGQEASIRQMQAALGEHQAVRRDVAQLRAQIVKQAGRLEALAGRTEAFFDLIDNLWKGLEAVRDVPGRSVPAGEDGAYQRLVRRIRETVKAVLGQGATVVVVSKGDDDLLKLGSCRGWHFPQSEDGVYAGHYPADSAEAIAQLEALRAKGADFVVFPEPALWWLKHYAGFNEHLETHYPLVVQREDLCLIFDLRGRKPGGQATRAAAGCVSEEAPPALPRVPAHSAGPHYGRATEQAGLGARCPDVYGDVELEIARSHRRKILVLGIYLGDQPNNVAAIVAALAEARRYHVTQRWVGLGGGRPTEPVARVTAGTLPEKMPKYQILNDLLAGQDLSQFEYVLTTDDDIALPSRFIDRFLSLQADLDFVIAQPARTLNSFADYPMVLQQCGVVARQTRFVEAGPLVSFHKSIFHLVFPFDLISPMGWGYENVWSRQLAERELKMGIIDVFPIEHTMRPRGVLYDCSHAERGRKALLEKTAHFSLEECFRVVEVVPFEEASQWVPR